MIIKDEILNSIEDIIKDYKVFLVGGYLRDYLINSEISHDRDLVCLEKTKEFALEVSKKLDASFVVLDSDYEIYRVVLKDKINYIDIAKALDNDILKDIKRRDFTINSIAYDLNKKEILDPLGGICDIKNKIIRTFDFKNLEDDPLRFLRLYRFFSKFGFKIGEKLNDFTKRKFHLIETVAKERIHTEIIEIFKGDYLVETLLKMFDDGVLEIIFPFVSDIKKIPPNSHHHLDLVHHSIETVKNIRFDKPLLKLSAFYHDIGKPSTWSIEPNGRHRFIGHDIKGAEIVKKELKNLKFSKKEIEYISKMVKYHIYPATLVHCCDNKKAFSRFVKKLGTDSPDIIELSRADRLSAQGEAITKEMTDKALAHLENLLEYYNEVSSLIKEPKALLNGTEIMELLNIAPSKKIGEILDEIKEKQLSKEISTKDEAIDFVKNKAVKRI